MVRATAPMYLILILSTMCVCVCVCVWCVCVLYLRSVRLRCRNRERTSVLSVLYRGTFSSGILCRHKLTYTDVDVVC